MEQIQSTIHHPSNSNGEVIISIEDDVLDEVYRECDGEETAQNAFKWFQTNFTRRSLPDKMKVTDFIRRINELSEDFSDQLFVLINGKRGASIHLHELIGAVYRLISERCQRKEASDLFGSFRKLCPGCQETRRVSKEDFKRVIQSKKGMKMLYSVLKDPTDDLLTWEELATKLQVLSRMDRESKWRSWFEYQYGGYDNKDRNIDLTEFKEILQLTKSTFFAERFFKIWDRSNSQRVSTRHLLYILNLLTYGNDEDRSRVLFQLYDINDDGYIDKSELNSVMKSCLEENSMTCTETQLNDLTELLYQDFSVTTGLGIDFETFQRYIQKNKDILKNIKASATKWLNGPEHQQRRSKPPSMFRYCFSYLRNHLSCIVFIVFYIVLNAGLFAEAAYRNYSAPPNVWIIIAKGCGRSLNFNSAFIVVLMLRKCLTWLRPTRLGHALPLDQHIDLHKMVGWVVVSLSVIHTTAHLMNLGFQWSGNLPFVTGVILVSVLVVMVVCSLPFVRRKGYFQLFYWTHQLFFIWWICLLVHATTFWIWVLFPAMLYAMERVHRTKWIRKPHNGRTYIEKGTILPSKVVHLKIRRPAHFTFKAGDYVYVNIPSIAKHEWHPFTISSAPEQKDYLELHVRVVGTWTRKLYGYYKRCGELSKEDSPSVAFLEEAVKSIPDLLEDLDLIDVEIEELDREQAVTNMPNIVVVGNEEATVHNKGVNTDSAPNDSRRNLSNQVCVGDVDPLSHEVTAIIPDGASPERASTIPTISESIHYNLQNVGVGIEINFDGPYGSPSERIFESEHAVLVGAGIGVTPFASILQSIHERHKAAKRTCPECKYAWKEEIPESELKLRKVDFIWINRDQKSFEWFVDLIWRLEKDLQEHGPFDNFLNFHLYMTSAIHIQQCAGFGLELALDLLHRRDRRDLLTGLQSRTKSGRPDWDKVLGKIRQEKKGEVTIFYCGPRQLGQQLTRKSYQFGMKFRQEIF